MGRSWMAFLLALQGLALAQALEIVPLSGETRMAALEEVRRGQGLWSFTAHLVYDTLGRSGTYRVLVELVPAGPSGASLAAYLTPGTPRSSRAPAPGPWGWAAGPGGPRASRPSSRGWGPCGPVSPSPWSWRPGPPGPFPRLLLPPGDGGDPPPVKCALRPLSRDGGVAPLAGKGLGLVLGKNPK